MAIDFDDFDEVTPIVDAGKTESGGFKLRAVGKIEFVAMAVALVDQFNAVGAMSEGAGLKSAGRTTETHGAAFAGDAFLFAHKTNDGVWRRFIKLGAMSRL